MHIQRRLLPSISMLAAFDATARTGSLSRAARDLNLTQGAVSRQVAALEHQLGIVLLARRGRGVTLTPVGETYAKDIRAILATLRNATLTAISSPLSLSLAILPTFGTRWLIPRLPDFLRQHPDLTVSFVTKLVQFSFDTEAVDAAIHFGEPNWAGADCTFLMSEEAVPVCAPTLAEDPETLRPEDLQYLPLLHLESRADAWPEWFAANGVDTPATAGGMLFEQFALATQAAVAGIGVALMPRFLISNELDRGELVVLFDKAFTTEMAYYLVTPGNRVDYAPVVAFREWLLGVIRSERRAEHRAGGEEIWFAGDPTAG
jgi:DNA-binding transcriptional LysR family regulator